MNRHDPLFTHGGIRSVSNEMTVDGIRQGCSRERPPFATDEAEEISDQAHISTPMEIPLKTNLNLFDN
jgi:hypothetical protein